MASSMAAEPIFFTYLWADIGGAWNQDSPRCRWTLYRLSFSGSAHKKNVFVHFEWIFISPGCDWSAHKLLDRNNWIFPILNLKVIQIRLGLSFQNNSFCIWSRTYNLLILSQDHTWLILFLLIKLIQDTKKLKKNSVTRRILFVIHVQAYTTK